MDDTRFDRWTRQWGERRSRRSLLKGLLGLGGTAAVATVTTRDTAAQWSVQICLPDGAGSYILRLVPKAAVPFYVSRYGGVLPENGSCPCEPDCSGRECGNDGCGGSCGSCGSNETCDGGQCVCAPSTHDCGFICKTLCSFRPGFYQDRFQFCYGNPELGNGNCAFCASWMNCYGELDTGIEACGEVQGEC